MRRILSFDTSAAHCAAALLCDGVITAQRVEPMEKGQAERLLPMLEGMLAGEGLAWRDLNALAVGTGPGNFTGVRIAVALARGLSLSLGIPAIGVTRLQALAHGLPRPVWVVEDAKRGEVYAQRFDPMAEGAARLTTPDALELDAPHAGNALPGGLVTPALTPAMAIVAEEWLASGAALPRPAPFYLRGADAAPPSDPPPLILDEHDP